MKRNHKLKLQLEKWEKDKEQKEKLILYDSNIQREDKHKELHIKRMKEYRQMQLKKIEEYKKNKLLVAQNQIDPDKQERQKFYKNVYMKKLRLKTEFKHLRKSQERSVPRYNLNSSEIIKSYIKNETPVIKEETSQRAKSKESIGMNLRRYGKGHIEALVHLNTTVSALGIYSNPFPK